MPGLYFIALNRILAPAFYAQSDTKSPTFAGLISFGVNITIAALLVSRFRGAGIAFALSMASAVNTAALIVFLKKNPSITIGRIIKPVLGYTLKLLLLSGIAVIPVLALSPRLAEFFSDQDRLIAQGAPLFIGAIVYAAAGIILLAATRDKQLLGIVKLIRRR
jgi:putative peptidoglycan lipid II flippase